jgi:8-amino-7-oxononanoate synthase
MLANLKVTGGCAATRALATSPHTLEQRIERRLAERASAGLRRALMPAPPGLLDFASNDYLGLRDHSGVKQAFAEAAQRYGLGAGASHLLGGQHATHVALEDALCEWTGRDAAALFSSGFQAALGALGALAQPKDFIVADRLAHACLLDGARYAGGELRRFAHNDCAAAAALLSTPSAHAIPHDALRWLVSESVFSMDGDQAPVTELAAVAEQTGAHFMLDEAHAIGVLGPDGAGLAKACALTQAQCPVLMLTFGKALGSAGAAILGAPSIIAAIVNYARPWIYTTAMPPALAAGTLKAVELARRGDALRATLAANIALFRTLAVAHGLDIGASQTAIQPVLVGVTGVVAWSERLKNAGFYVPAVRPPTVPLGGERFRVSLSARHTPAQISALVSAMAATRPLR